MQRIFKSSFILFIILFILSACAVKRQYVIETQPDAATIKIENNYKGKSPYEVTLEYKADKNSFNVEVSKKGYKDIKFQLTKDYNGEYKTKEEDKKIYLSIPLEPLTKEISIESEPSNARVFLNDIYVDRTPTKVKLEYGERESNTIRLSKFGYKDVVKKIPLNFKLKSLLFHLQQKETRKMAYMLSDIRDNKVKFIITYEDAYKDTIENSPNALHVNRIMQAEDINVLIGRIDASDDYLVFTKIYPKNQINTEQYISRIDSLTKTLTTLQSIFRYSENYSTLKEKKELVKLTNIILEDNGIREALPSKIYTHLTEVLSEVKSDGTADNYLEDIRTMISFISEELNKLTTIKINEFYSEIWAVGLNENFKKSKITFTDGKWIDNAPSIYKKDVYFASNRNSKEFDIWRVKIGGGSGITKITNSPYSQDMEPSINEKGSLLSYSSLPLGAKEYQIWTINSDGTLPSQLKRGKPTSICSNKIAFVRKNKNGKSQIWLINTNGAEETLLSTNMNVNESEPSFSPDCKWIVYTSDESGNKDIWMMRADGSHRTQLTTNPSTDIHPTWGDDGYVYFVSNRGLLWGIWRLQPKRAD